MVKTATLLALACVLMTCAMCHPNLEQIAAAADPEDHRIKACGNDFNRVARALCNNCLMVENTDVDNSRKDRFYSLREYCCIRGCNVYTVKSYCCQSHKLRRASLRRFLGLQR